MQISVTSCNSDKKSVNCTKNVFVLSSLTTGKDYRKCSLETIHALKLLTLTTTYLIHLMSLWLFLPLHGLNVHSFHLALRGPWISHCWFWSTVPNSNEEKKYLGDSHGSWLYSVLPKCLPAVQRGCQWRKLFLFCLMSVHLIELCQNAS